jgi:hypothetical protein
MACISHSILSRKAAFTVSTADGKIGLSLVVHGFLVFPIHVAAWKDTFIGAEFLYAAVCALIYFSATVIVCVY